MKYFNLLLLVVLITSCSKTPPTGVGIRIDNQTDINLISFDVVVSTTTGVETISYSKIDENSISDYIFIDQLNYMYHDASKPLIGNNFKAVVKKDGVEVEIEFIYGFCGTGMTFTDTEDGFFRLDITSIDIDQKYISVEGVDEN